MIKIDITKTKQLLQDKVEWKKVLKIIDSKRYYRVSSVGYLDIHKDIDIIIRLYEECYWSFYKIGMLCGVSDTTAKKWCIQGGVNNKGHQRGDNSSNDYFSIIDTKDKAYFLGFMFADGSIVKNKSSYIVSMTITQQDDYILKTFLCCAKIKTTIWTVHKDDARPRSQINICSKKMYYDLDALGCEQNKSSKEILRLPTLEKALIPHFIRGYFDGDGIAFSNGRLGFCGNKSILEYINNYFNKILQNNNVSITYNPSNHIYYLVYNKKTHIEQILDILYKDCDNLFLTRKYQKYRPLL